jgi:Ca2+-binding RTX toxin-like protein
VMSNSRTTMTGEGDDWLASNLGGDVLYGGGGVDRLDGNDGADVLYGGDGNDAQTSFTVRDGSNNPWIVTGGLYGGNGVSWFSTYETRVLPSCGLRGTRLGCVRQGPDGVYRG